MNDKTLAIQKMQEYIFKHIKESITINDLARTSGYSPFYAHHMFKEVIGISPFEYIRKIRLTEAAKLLRDTSTHVIDVAFDFQFDSHEGFTRAFAREFDISPKAYQTRKIPLKYFVPYLVTEKEKEKDSMSNKAVFVQVIERPLRKAIIKRGIKAHEYFEYCNEVGCDVWGVLTSIKEAINEPMGMWLSSSLIKKGTSEYVQGVEVPFDYNKIVPEGFELIELPATKMLVFQGEPYDDNDFGKEVEEVMNFVSKYNPVVYGYEYDNTGYRFQFEPQGFRGYIEGRTINKI